MDDLDPHRSDRRTALDILATLERHGLESDAPCVWQSEREPLYQRALETLRRGGRVFECKCSRKRLAGHSLYPGNCRNSAIPPDPNQSTRFIAPAVTIKIRDEVQGDYQQHLATKCGDFVVYRRDSVTAYHLATVVDDADMGITRVVRGADLLESTPRQVALAEALGYRAPSFGHIPLVLDAQERKASKSLAATPVEALSETHVKCNLAWCLALLGMQSPSLHGHSPSSLLEWASKRFRIDQVPSVPVRSDFLCL